MTLMKTLKILNKSGNVHIISYNEASSNTINVELVKAVKLLLQAIFLVNQQLFTKKKLICINKLILYFPVW